ncbi:MAG: hypothetical protein ACOYMB_02345 [Patescibacteria group bacterium]
MKGLFHFLLACVIAVCVVMVFSTALSKFLEKPETMKNCNLFYPKSGDLQVKVTNKYQSNGKYICEEQTLDNIVYAQLRLYPTIGCEKPTLFYLENGSNEIKKIVVSEAELVR